MQFWKTKQFKELSIVWEEKLKESGFNERLDTIASTSYGKASQLERELRLDYYLRIERWITETQFPNEIEAHIMKMHGQGASIREIISEIQRLGFTRDRKTVRFIIRRYQTKWGLRKWSLKQMNLRKVAIK